MLFAKNRITASKISSLFLNNQIKKFYISVTNNKFNKNTDTLINYNSDKKELKLVYRKIQLGNHENCYLIKLFTGKKHQIRLQFYLNKNPIIGDKKFSGIKFNFSATYFSTNGSTLAKVPIAPDIAQIEISKSAFSSLILFLWNSE